MLCKMYIGTKCDYVQNNIKNDMPILPLTPVTHGMDIYGSPKRLCFDACYYLQFLVITSLSNLFSQDLKLLS